MFRSEATVDVCVDVGIGGVAARASESSAATLKWPIHDRGQIELCDRTDNVLDILVQSRRNKKAAKKFFRKLLKGCSTCRGWSSRIS